MNDLGLRLPSSCDLEMISAITKRHKSVLTDILKVTGSLRSDSLANVKSSRLSLSMV